MLGAVWVVGAVGVVWAVRARGCSGHAVAALNHSLNTGSGVGGGSGGGGVGGKGAGGVRARSGSLERLFKHLQKGLGMLGAVWVVGAVGAVGGMWAVRARGGPGHALEAFKYSLNTYKRV